jgi:hypothetical protein
MKAQVSTTKTVKLTDLMGEPYKIDPITVYLADDAPGSGKITIECYGQSWSSYWGGMSGMDVATFFCSCDTAYLSGKLSSINSSVPDFEQLVIDAREQVIQMRKDKDLTKYEARDLYDDCDELSESPQDNPIMSKIFGSEWWSAIPEKENPDYQYLCRIIRAVQEGLKLSGLVKQKEAA